MDKGTSASKGWLCSPASGPCTLLYRSWYLVCSQPCRSSYESVVHHDTASHACSLQGGSPEAADRFWGCDAECLMLSSMVAVRRQLPGLVPGEQPCCLAPQHPIQMPHCVHIWSWRGAGVCWEVGTWGSPLPQEEMPWRGGPCWESQCLDVALGKRLR